MKLKFNFFSSQKKLMSIFFSFFFFLTWKGRRRKLSSRKNDANSRKNRKEERTQVQTSIIRLSLLDLSTINEITTTYCNHQYRSCTISRDRSWCIPTKWTVHCWNGCCLHRRNNGTVSKDCIHIFSPIHSNNRPVESYVPLWWRCASSRCLLKPLCLPSDLSRK